MKQLVGLIVLVFAGFYLVTQPESAANLVKDGANALGEGFDAVIAFISTLFS